MIAVDLNGDGRLDFLATCKEKLMASRLGSRQLMLSSVVLIALLGARGEADQPTPSKNAVVAKTPRLALLVGISKYPQVTTHAWRPLHAKRDLAELKRVLMTPRYGFRAEEILVLEDRAATAAGIRSAFADHLIAKANPGAVVVFHFSGHGQQVPDQNGDELDGLDETLVPYDAVDQRASEGAKVNLRDDEIAAWLRELQAKMRGPSGKVEGSISVFLDSCFSGTATRGMLVERGRGWNIEMDGPKPAPSALKPSHWAGSDPNSFLDDEGAYIALSAAQSDQTAKEIGDIGLFTRALVGALERASDQTTYRDLLDEASAEVLASVRNQLPQLEGNPDRRLFNGAGRPTPATVRVISVTDDLLTIPAGKTHLMTVGSVYEIHQAGSGPLSAATQLAVAEVVAVEPLQSQLRLRPGSYKKDLAAGLLAARTVEKAHQYAAVPLRVFLTDLARQPALTEFIKKLPMVTVSGVGPQDYHVEVRLARGEIELRRPEDSCPFQKFSGLPQDEATDRLEQLLRAEWRWRQLVELRQANPNVQARLRLVPTDVTLNSAGRVITSTPHPDRASNQLALHEGDSFMLEFINPSRSDVWVTVLQLERSGSISVLFPISGQAGDGLIRAGDTRLAPRPYIFRIAPPLGPTVFKVIATMEKVDLSRLTQAAYATSRQLLVHGDNEPSRAVARLMAGISKPLHPLAQLLADAAQAQRSLSAATELGAWSVTDAVLLQEPRAGTVRGERCDDRGVPK